MYTVWTSSSHFEVSGIDLVNAKISPRVEVAPRNCDRKYSVAVAELYWIRSVCACRMGHIVIIGKCFFLQYYIIDFWIL